MSIPVARKIFPNHVARRLEGIQLERLKHLRVGGKMGDLPEHLQHRSFVRVGAKKTGGPNLRLIRLMPDRPSLTVTAYVFNKFVHQTADRYITVREAACLQDFPDDYTFVGNLSEAQHQVGNAVPVRLATAIGNHVANYLASHGRKGVVPVASYFTGAGGFDLGFERVHAHRVKYRTAFSTDIDRASCQTIALNRKGWNPMQADIRELSPRDVIDAIGERPCVVIGGPPCQTFSVAGKQKGTTDPLGKLYRDYVRHIGELKPEVVVMENVYGLLQVKASATLEEIYRAYEGIGYHLEHHELLAADFGTPQMRRRVIFFAIRGKHGLGAPPQTHSPNSNLFGLKAYNGAGDSMAHLPPPYYADEVCHTRQVANAQATTLRELLWPI